MSKQTDEDQESQDAAALQRHLDAEDLPSIEERVVALEKFIKEMQ